MPLIQDPSLGAHIDQVRDGYQTTQAALGGQGATDLTDAGGAESGLVGVNTPATQVPAPTGDVAAAIARFQQQWQADHQGQPFPWDIVQFIHIVNNELQERWPVTPDAADVGPNPVQISQTIAVATREGAYVEVWQWIARPKDGA